MDKEIMKKHKVSLMGRVLGIMLLLDKVVVPGTIENFGASVEGRVGGCGFKATIDSCADGGGVL